MIISPNPIPLKINVVTPGGKTSYTVPIIKVQQYSLDELFENKLLFFLPFYIFDYKKDLPQCDADEAMVNPYFADTCAAIVAQCRIHH